MASWAWGILPMEKLGLKDFSVSRSITLLVIFLTITPVVLGISLFSLFSLDLKNPQHLSSNVAAKSLIETPQSGLRVYASLPATYPQITETVGADDARTAIVRDYFKRYNSPLVPYASLIVQTADKYNLDYRLLPAIAQQESNVCKIFPAGTFNCWGYGIHSKGTLGFSSFEEGIETVSRGLRENYLNLGLITPEQIMTKYTPLSNGSWAQGVKSFMSEMQ